MKKNLSLIAAFCLLLAATNANAQTTNTFPTTGNAGVGTTSPTSTLQVAGTVTIDSSVVIRDSLRVDSGIVVGGKTRLKGDLVVTGNVKVKGSLRAKDKLVVDSIARLKDRLVVEGKAKMKDDAVVFGNFKLKGLEDFNAPNKRVIGINQSGKVLPIPPQTLIDNVYEKITCVPPFPLPKWNAETNKLWVDCPPQTKVGIGTEFPSKKLQVIGDASFSADVGIGTTTPGAQLGVRNISSQNAINSQFFDSENRRLFIVPKLSGWGYSKLSQNGDVGIFYSDNVNQNGSNVNAGLVIAPFGGPDYNGIRIGADGNIIITGGNAGNVGIGTTSPDTKLTVDGDAKIVGNTKITGDLDVCGMIGTTEVIVETPWCDYVFDKNHKRMTFEERRSFYPKNKHLPMLEPGWKIERDGLGVGSTLKGLTFNLEEFGLNQLDLYDMIQEKDRKINKLEKRIELLEQKLEALTN